MLESLIALAAAVAVFAVFFLVFFIRRRSDKAQPIDFRGCPRCTCSGRDDMSARREDCRDR
jgi:hypothetical protein